MKLNYIFAMSKIFIMHWQIVYLTGVFNLDLGIKMQGFLSIIGNPHKIMSGSLKCFEFLLNLSDEYKSFKYYV